MVVANGYNNLIESLIQRKRTFDTLNVKIMDDKDFEIAENVAKLLPSVDAKTSITGSIISQDEAFSRSYEHLRVFDQKYVDLTKKNAKNIKVENVFDSFFTFTTFVQYSLLENIMKIDENSGTVDHFKTPVVFDEVSPLWLAHEQVHALKETNYKEYSDIATFSDVIPMFLELVLADDISKEQYSSFIRNRLFLLKNEYSSTSKVKEVLCDTYKRDDLYRVFASSAMQYLNSFYYSLQLYDMYKSNKNEVLPKINEVLDKTKSTREMLQDLGILHNYNDKSTRLGISSLTKRLR